MTQVTVSKKIHKTAEEMENLIRLSRRKLLEFEVMLSLSEIKQGKVHIFKNAAELFKNLK